VAFPARKYNSELTALLDRTPNAPLKDVLLHADFSTALRNEATQLRAYAISHLDELFDQALDAAPPPDDKTAVQVTHMATRFLSGPKGGLQQKIQEVPAHYGLLVGFLRERDGGSGRTLSRPDIPIRSVGRAAL
jgi:hypothetical protein